MPILSANKKDKKFYEREKYIYCLNLIIRKSAFLCPHWHKIYRYAIQELSYYFKKLEEEYHIIYNNHANRAYLLEKMKQIYKDFQSSNYCFLTHECRNYLFINCSQPLYPQLAL